MKTCNKCLKSQNYSNFSISHTNTDGLSGSCKKCNNEYAKAYYQKNKEKIADAQRNWQKKNKQKKRIIESNWVSKNKERRYYSTIKSKYGLSKEQFLEMVNAQKGFCKICKSVKHTEEQRLHIDHCHVTGKVRGLLCVDCNLMIGHAKDKSDILKNGIEYLTLSKSDESA